MKVTEEKDINFIREEVSKLYKKWVGDLENLSKELGDFHKALTIYMSTAQTFIVQIKDLVEKSGGNVTEHYPCKGAEN